MVNRTLIYKYNAILYNNANSRFLLYDVNKGYLRLTRESTFKWHQKKRQPAIPKRKLTSFF